MPEIKLTTEQVRNWRRTLSLTIGPYAFFMPKEEILRYAQRMQGLIDKIENESWPYGEGQESEPCRSCSALGCKGVDCGMPDETKGE